MNKNQIEKHLRCAIQQTTPNVLDAILTGNYQQDQAHSTERKVFKIPNLKALSTVIAACLVLFVFTGGLQFYNLNYKVNSVIELDVNPSIEMSVNKGNKVLGIKANNKDAVAILDGMELKGVDLKIALNAVIGSMVQHGYLDDSDSAILVTVSNDSAEKAEVITKEVLTNIEASLAENKVEANVINQQVNPTDQLLELANTYNISYGKANFIQKLVEKEPSLSMDALALMSMSAISNLIHVMNIDISDLSGFEYAEKIIEVTLEANTENVTEGTTATADSGTSEAITNSQNEPTTTPNTSLPTESTKPVETIATPSAEVPGTDNNLANKVKLSDAFYKNGMVRIYFEGLVSWKNPMVSVADESGEPYAAMITDYQEDYCEIYIYGIKNSGEYTYTIGGVKNKNSTLYTIVEGTVEVSSKEIPVPETTAPETKAPETTVASTEQVNSVSLEPTSPVEPPAAIISIVPQQLADNFLLKFSKDVEWTAPTITVINELGNSYVVSLLDKSDKSCILAIDALEPGHWYTVKISGITAKNSTKPIELTTFFGYYN